MGTRKKRAACGKSYPELLAAAALVTVSLTEGRTNEELETLLNFVHLLEYNLHAVLAQRLIDERVAEQLEINLD